MIMFRKGQTVYFLQSKKNVIQARIIAVSGGFYTLKLADGGGIRLRESRLYATEEDAKKEIQKPYVKPKLYWGLDE